MARLEFEKIQREAQSEERKEREAEKDELDARIRQKKEQLAKLKPQLQNILAVSEIPLFTFVYFRLQTRN